MRAVIIGNRLAGRAGDEERLERCARILASGGLEAEIWATDYPGHATELATEAGERLIVAAGGDGTVNEVINGLAADATLGILPLGTANVLAKELGLPMRLEKACERLVTGEGLRIDLGLATDEAGRWRRFACMAGLGFDANVIEEVTPAMKRRLKVSAFALAAFQVYLKGTLPGMEVTCGGEVHETQLAIVANGRQYGGDLRVTHEGSVTSGDLSVVMVDKVGTLLRPDHLGRLLARRPLSGFTPSISDKEVLARPLDEKVPVQLDGEVWGRLPMSFRVQPASLRVIR